MPPTLETTIDQLKRAAECQLKLDNGSLIAGSGLVNYAGHLLERQQAELIQLRAELEALKR